MTPGCQRARCLAAVMTPAQIADGAADGARVDAEPPVDALGGDPFQNVRHRRSFPLPSPRRGDAPPVESGCDLAQRLRASGLDLPNSREDDVCMRFGPRYTAGVDGGTGVG